MSMFDEIRDEFLSEKENPSDGRLHIEDTRKVDAATGKGIKEGNKMSTKANIELVKDIISKAKKYGVDPYTAISIGINETGLNPGSSYMGKDNVFQLNTGDELPNKELVSDSIKKYGNIETFMKVFKHKMGYALKLGKTNEEDMIQGYNGYGTLKDVGTLYGVDTSKEPINFSKNPIYGKKIVDIRDNVVKMNPDIVKLVTDTK